MYIMYLCVLLFQSKFGMKSTFTFTRRTREHHGFFW